ncbi:hypothetical protein RCH09_001929 [Actimicrobium sp. GrIS 1.19]|uniref:DUF4136 domain-containing protein n=1 Tax=Actimicrobium sp. GrIS 1.19 TaxID=3071708 RepID=UPI002DFEEE4C|nr:hypothetical protein [Actimicrobium sp. GrIS 1.19]
MKRTTALLFAAACLALSGCASTIRSNVTAFNDWPAELPDKSYGFERTQEQNQNLEYLSYENLVRAEVNRLGLTEAQSNRKPALKVTLSFAANEVDVTSVEPVFVDPYFYGSGYYGRGFYPRPFYRGAYDPFFWGPPTVAYQQRSYALQRRQLQVRISRNADGKSLYDVKVNSEGENSSLAAVMPYMVRSAFAEFPGKSGATRTVEMKMED